MLTRLRLDNFRCFVDFEFKPAQGQLILGGNGTGKSSLLEALFSIRQSVIQGLPLDAAFLMLNRTRWLKHPTIASELETRIEGRHYIYRVAMDEAGHPAKARIASETVHCDGRPVFEFQDGEVHLYNDRLERTATYDSDWHRSGLGAVMVRKDSEILGLFKQWLSRLYCFKLNPFAMTSRAEKEDPAVAANLSNFAAWYRYLRLADYGTGSELMHSLRHSIDGLDSLNFEPFGENVHLLRADFKGGWRCYFNELSEGQRCLVCLYTILHFILPKGGTVVIDEPDNFLALREIQPWLMAASDAIEESGGQLIIISHHPEIINQWAPGGGVMFVRDDAGPVRVEPFDAKSYTSLTPAEIVARGWERE